MKNIIMPLLLCIVPLTVEAAKCPSGVGYTVQGNDQTYYCRSRVGMTWWSANVWCESIGQTLINLDNECYTVTGEGECPNLYLPAISGVYVWTRNQRTDSQAEIIFLNYGKISGLESAGIHKHATHHALCK